jgi:hypothetical protein
MREDMLSGCPQPIKRTTAPSLRRASHFRMCLSDYGRRTCLVQSRKCVQIFSFRSKLPSAPFRMPPRLASTTTAFSTQNPRLKSPRWNRGTVPPRGRLKSESHTSAIPSRLSKPPAVWGARARVSDSPWPLFYGIFTAHSPWLKCPESIVRPVSNHLLPAFWRSPCDSPSPPFPSPGIRSLAPHLRQ